MMIEKCKECGCPQVGRRYHYKKCSILQGYNLSLCRIYDIEPDEFKVIVKSEIESLESNAHYYLKMAKENHQLAGEYRDCLKNTCLDEVYECRLDCCIIPEGVWLN